MKFDISPLYYINSANIGERYSLYDLASWKNGLPFRKIDFSDKGKPIIKIAELNNGLSSNTAYTEKEYSKDVHLTKGDFVFSWSGNPETSIDIFRYALPDGWLNQHIFKVIPKENTVNKEYFFYMMKYLKPQFKAIATNKQTTGLGHITIADLKRISVILPNPNVQQRIAMTLKVIDDKIELNERINNNLEQQASVLYSHFFEEIPSDKLKEGYLSDIAEVASGKRPPMKSALRTNEMSIPIVGAAAIMGYTNTSNYNNKILVIGRVGTHGIVQRLNAPCWASDNTLVITSRYYEYLYQILKRIDYHALNRGSTQPLITQGDINKVPVIIPDDKILTKYETLAGSLMFQYEANVIESAKLSDVRDTLLPKLMSGELDVSELDL